MDTFAKCMGGAKQAPEITYFPSRGRAEPLRLCFALKVRSQDLTSSLFFVLRPPPRLLTATAPFSHLLTLSVAPKGIEFTEKAPEKMHEDKETYPCEWPPVCALARWLALRRGAAAIPPRPGSTSSSFSRR